MKKMVGFLASILLVTLPLSAKYKIREIPIQPGATYACHQNFQKIIIAVQPSTSDAETLQWFDTKKLNEKKIMPVLVVIENNNDFVVRLRGSDIYFVDQSGTQVPPLGFEELLRRIGTEKRLGSYSTKKEILIRLAGSRELYEDFENKYLSERLVSPHSTDFGVVFFPHPSEPGLAGTRIYIPHIFNLTREEELMFFEIDLGGSRGAK